MLGAMMFKQTQTPFDVPGNWPGGGGGGGGGGFALYLSPNSISSTYIGETAVAFTDLSKPNFISEINNGLFFL